MFKVVKKAGFSGINRYLWCLSCLSPIHNNSHTYQFSVSGSRVSVFGFQFSVFGHLSIFRMNHRHEPDRQ